MAGVTCCKPACLRSKYCTLCPCLQMRPPSSPHKRSSRSKRKPAKKRKPKRKPAPKRKPKPKPKRKKPKRPSSGVPKRRKPAPKRKRPSKRSQAAKRGWEKRRKRQKILDLMFQHNARAALPTGDELEDYLTWAANNLDVDLNEMYRMYWGVVSPK